MGETPILFVMPFWADCGFKLYQVRARGLMHEQEHFIVLHTSKLKEVVLILHINNVQV